MICINWILAIGVTALALFGLAIICAFLWANFGNWEHQP